MDLLRDSLTQDPTFLVTVSKELLSSGDDGVSKLAAITLAERGTVDANILTKVRSAIVGDDTALVLSAIPALALVRQGLPDEILVILAMDKEGHAGYGHGITTAAEKAVSTFILTDSHVPALTQILGSYNSTVRLNAVNHLGAIQTSLSTSSLIGALLLSDSTVQARAKTFLEQRTLTNQELQLLTGQTSNKDASIRETAIELIERIQTKESNAFLVGLALQILQDTHAYKREDEISILGKVNSTEATNDLIIALFDSDGTVVNTAIGQLKHRVLTDDQISSLQQVLGSIHSDVRDLAIPLLGKIFTDKSTTLLIAFLEDPDARVARDTNQQLQLRTFNSDQVILLARVLGASDTSVRKEAAFLLGNANDAVSGKKAYDLLNASVKIETDYQVILEMKRSAILLQAKYGLI